MPSLRYHAGRMVLKQEANGWSVTIKTKSEKIRYALSAVELQDAVMQAEQLYADVRTLNNGQPRCMDCIHWELIKANCNVGCPEGKLTGGSFAKDCAYFWPNP
jgi:hypothetical protein